MENKIHPPASARHERAGRQLMGLVVSDKMNHTVIVKVNSVNVHPKYHKRYTVSKKFPAHNDLEGIKVGDKVTIEESRPYSKTVHWKVISKN